MKYRIEYRGIRVEVIEATLPKNLDMFCCQQEMPNTLFLESSLAYETKTQIILRYFLELLRQYPGKAAALVPVPVVDQAEANI